MHFFGLAVFISFIALFVDLRLKLVLYMVFVCFYLVIIFIPFRFANNIAVKVYL